MKEIGWKKWKEKNKIFFDIDIMPLLKIENGRLTKLHVFSDYLEKDIQNLLEQNLKESLGMKFLASEFSITGGRIDSLALDTNGSPVIIEYKKGKNSSVIPQIAFYYDWLQDHKETFEKLVRSKNIDQEIVWENPRLICIAQSYNFYDYSAVKHFSVHIELLKYQFFNNDLLYITADRPIEIEERLNKVCSVQKNITEKGKSTLSLQEFLQSIESQSQRILFEDIRECILEISGDIQEKIYKSYTSYRSTINFCDLQPLKNGKVALQIPNTLLPQKEIDSIPHNKRKVWSSFSISKTQDLESVQNILHHAYKESI